MLPNVFPECPSISSQQATDFHLAGRGSTLEETGQIDDLHPVSRQGEFHFVQATLKDGPAATVHVPYNRLFFK